MTALLPCIPPFAPMWFFAGASVLVMLAVWGVAVGVSRWTRRYERPAPLPSVEAWHAHVLKVPWDLRGIGVGRCDCGVTGAVLVEAE